MRLALPTPPRVPVATLTLTAYQAIDFPRGDLDEAKAAIGRILVGGIMHEIRGDLESENARLRAAVEKWSGRVHPGGPAEALMYRDELREDLR